MDKINGKRSYPGSKEGRVEMGRREGLDWASWRGRKTRENIELASYLYGYPTEKDNDSWIVYEFRTQSDQRSSLENDRTRNETDRVFWREFHSILSSFIFK